MTDSGKILKNQEKIHDILPNGQKRFTKGNQIGRMKKKGFTLTDLNKLVRVYEEAHDKPILKHYVDELFKDNRLLEKYIDKNVPTINKNELTGVDGSPLTFIVEKSYNKPEGEVIDKKEV